MAHLRLRDTLLVDGAGQPHTIEAVLFDKDGTLSISEPMLHTLARARVNEALALCQASHPQVLPTEAACLELKQLLQRAYGLHHETARVHPAGTTAVGSRVHNLISTATVLSQMHLGWPEAMELAEAVFAATDRLHGGGSPHRPAATPGLHDLLQRLGTAGLRCAVISNDEVAGIEAFLHSQDLAHRFDGLWSAEHRPCKPDPAAVFGLCRQLEVPPGRCALIGDANSDLRMARSAGVAVVLGYSAAWSTPPPLDAEFDQISDWMELQVVPTTGVSDLGE